MSYQSIKKLYRSGNIAAAKAALVEALKNNTLTAVEKKSVIRLNSEPLLEAYVAFMPPEPKKWEIMEIVHTGNVKIIDSLEVAEFPVAAQQELLKLNDVGIFRRLQTLPESQILQPGGRFHHPFRRSQICRRLSCRQLAGQRGGGSAAGQQRPLPDPELFRQV